MSIDQPDNQVFPTVPGHIRLIIILVFLSIGIVIYKKTLDDQFHFDDLHVFASLSFEHIVQKCKHPNRFFPHLSFLFNRYLHGSNVYGYHILNILIHIVNACLVMYVVYQLNLLYPGDKNKEKSFQQGMLLCVSTVAGLLFLVHPLATQSVSYISQRYTSIAAFFYLLSIICYINARIIYKSQGLFTARSHLMWYLLCILTAICAVLSKEYAVTLPAIIILTECFFIQPDFREIKKRLVYIAPIFSSSLLIVVIHFNLFQIPNESGSLTQSITSAIDQHLPRWASDEIPRHVYFLSQIPIIVTVYLKLFFYPCRQNIDHDFLIIDSFFNINVLISISVIIFLLFLSILSFRKLRLISFGILWFFITIFPTSSIIPNSEFVSEHRTYLSMTGLIFLYIEFFRQSRYKRIFLTLSICLIAILGYLTNQRNDVWENDIALWQDSVKKSPDKARPWFALGVAFETAGQFEKAKHSYATSIKIFPDYVLALNNLGNIYQHCGDLNAAVKFYNRAIELNPDYAEAHYNLGLIYNKQNKLAQALEKTQKALALKPGYVDAIYNLGFIYEKYGRLQDAIDHYKTVLKYNNSHEATHYNLAILAIRSGNTDIATFHLQQVVTINPKHIHANIVLANLYLDTGNLSAALKRTNQAANISSGHNADTHMQIGRLFEKTNFNDAAINEYNLALKYNPKSTKIHNCLGILYNRMGNESMALHHKKLSKTYHHDTKE